MKGSRKGSTAQFSSGISPHLSQETPDKTEKGVSLHFLHCCDAALLGADVLRRRLLEAIEQRGDECHRAFMRRETAEKKRGGFCHRRAPKISLACFGAP